MRIAEVTSNLYRINTLKLCYICIFLASSYRIITKTDLAANVDIVRILIETKLALILYILACFIFYIVLFTKFGSKVTDNRWFNPSTASFLVILAVALTLLGCLQSIDWASDNDEALEAWIQALFSGRYPYEATTNLGNPVSQFPFLLLYSIPYYLIGNVAIQNIVNIFIVLYVLRRLSLKKEHSTFGLISLLISLPLYLFLLTQSDHFTVAAITILGIYLLSRNKFTAASILFGCMIASKGYVWIIIPVTLYYIYCKAGYYSMVKCLLIYVLIASAFILPFLLWNPHVFFTKAPLGITSEGLVIQQESILSGLSLSPSFSYLITAITILFSLLVFWRTKDLFISLFSTYMFLGLFMFWKIALLISLSTTMLGIRAEYQKKPPYIWAGCIGVIIIIILIIKFMVVK